MKRILIIALMALGMAIMTQGFLSPPQAAAASNAAHIDESLRMGETHPTLDPRLFRDPLVRQAYQVARDIPWVLDSIYCFCYCKESPAFRHKSLLSCYVDNHASV